MQVRSDGSRELIAERITCIDDVLGGWTRRVLLEVDLVSMGAQDLERFEELLARHEAVQDAADPGGVRADDGAAVSTSVPVFIDVQRAEQRWFLECGRKITLSLDSLRALRGMAGLRNLTLDVTLPSPVSRGSWKGSA